MFEGRFLGKTPHIFLLRMACATAASKQCPPPVSAAKSFYFRAVSPSPPGICSAAAAPATACCNARRACMRASVCLSGESGGLSFRQINRHQEIPHSGFLRTNVACTGQKNMPSMMMMPYVLSPRFLSLLPQSEKTCKIMATKDIHQGRCSFREHPPSCPPPPRRAVGTVDVCA